MGKKMGNIYYINEEYFEKQAKEEKKAKLQRRQIKGLLLALVGVGSLAFGLAACHNKDTDTPVITPDAGFETKMPVEDVSVQLGDINSLNIIINDNNCSDAYIEGVCQELDKSRIKYSFSRENNRINQPNSVVITLDQQYTSGVDTCILTSSKNNAKNNDSDALALAMNKALNDQNIGTEIFCGKKGYSGSGNSVEERVPTSTESKITEDNTSYVTICLGTNLPDANTMAGIIKSGLARYVTYQKETAISMDDVSTDGIVRVSYGDVWSTLAEKFGCSTEKLAAANGRTTRDILNMDEAIVNPNVSEMAAFKNPVTVVSNVSKNNADSMNY